MIEVRVNGQSRAIPSSLNVYDLLVAIGIDPTRNGIAIALDGEVVPRSRWIETVVNGGAVVEVVSASQGG